MRFPGTLMGVALTLGVASACDAKLQECPQTQAVEQWTRCLGIWADPGGERLYSGEFLNGSFHGQGLLLRSGAPTYAGEFSGGAMHGLGVLSFDNGQRYVGNFENGVMSGYGRLLEADGRELYAGAFVNNAPATGAVAMPATSPAAAAPWSALSPSPPPPAAPALPGSSTVEALDPLGLPRFGVVRLEAGFLPDPHRVQVTGGGGDANPRSEAGCVGHLRAGPPTVRLDFQAGTLPLTIGAKGADDLNLVVQLPDGRFVCDDDGGDDLNPRLVLDRPGSGSYAIWVGTWESLPQGVAAEVTFSEIGSGQ